MYYQIETEPKDKRGYQTWGDVFRHYVSKGHDHGYAAFAADRWEATRQRIDAATDKAGEGGS